VRGAAVQLGPGHAVADPSAAPTAAPTSRSAAPVPAPSTSPAAFGGTLPNTGASPFPVVWIGLGLLTGGAALAFLGRRRSAKP
jgi:LPXTG-motif cell wall-anchored protein